MKHHVEVRLPIPRGTAPGAVVATLQAFEPLLVNHDYIIEYSPRPPGPINRQALAVINGDPFFARERAGQPPERVLANDRCSRWWLCDVWEDVYWVPFLVPYFSRPKRYLVVGCKTEGGIRFRQRVSGGTVTRGAFTVVARGTGRAYVAPPPPGPASALGREQNGESTWDGETEVGSVRSNSDEKDGRENRNHDDEAENKNGSQRGGPENEKGPRDQNAREGPGAEPELMWDLVCKCEIDMPLILLIPQILGKETDRRLCEQVCRSVLTEAIMESDDSTDCD